MSQESNQVNRKQVTLDSKPITALEAMEALNILKCQVGNARLRKMWSEPIKQYILQGLEEAEEETKADEGR